MSAVKVKWNRLCELARMLMISIIFPDSRMTRIPTVRSISEGWAIMG